ncbi:vitamin K epoxide reductase family protein [Candidatus Saccharibacteria bacterium]|nr:vitamin K epoxide reductase family protein [Candidatus Saccharibacteria bacterium]
MKTPTKTKPISTQAHPEHLSWLEKHVPTILIGSGLVGVFASLMLSIEEIEHLKHPAAKLGCDLNPIVGCGSIIDAWQGHALLGVPNQLWGLAIFAAVTTIGFTILAGATMKRWFWVSLQAGMTVGMLFVLWFMSQSLFVLKHLCPYCMLTWAAMLPAFWYITLYAIRAEHLKLHGNLAKINHFAQKHHADILASAYLLIFVAIVWRFWYYWQTLI